MNNQKEEFVKLLTIFKRKINHIPNTVEELNNNVDFTNGRPQEIMIDLEGLIETLDNDFYLFCEEVEKLIEEVIHG